jgi:hypothetical protein
MDKCPRCDGGSMMLECTCPESIPARGTLKIGEFHPAASSAMSFIKSLGLGELAMWQESFSSCAIENNRLAEICSETLDRVMTGKPVSDRYLLGLAWTIKNMGDKNGRTRKSTHANK